MRIEWQDRAETLDQLASEGPTGHGNEGKSLEAVMAVLAEPRESTASGQEASGPLESADEPETPQPLAIADLRFCRRVEGFGHYEDVKTTTFSPGEIVTLYCEMEGVTYQPEEEDFVSKLASSAAILPREGETPVWERTLGIAQETCRRPRRDYFVNYQFALPMSGRLDPGNYRLRLSQTDSLTGKTVSAVVPFSISSP